MKVGLSILKRVLRKVLAYIATCEHRPEERGPYEYLEKNILSERAAAQRH